MSEIIAAFAHGGLERLADQRKGMDPDARLAAGARILLFWNGQAALLAEGGLCLTSSNGAAETPPENLVFLGEGVGIGTVFAQDLGDAPEPPPLPEGALWADLRQSMLRLNAVEAEMAATGKAVLHWHRSHLFCAACGQPSGMAEAGWQRKCSACGTSHFPRTDPVVIMLISAGDQLLLGRSAGWPEGMYSTLAGFMEPGETVEAAVRREVAEETGVRVGKVRYVSSQPWPFPASLMLGCHGEALSTAITLDPDELEDALWLTRSEMLSVLAGLHPIIKPMRRGSIAHALVVNWLADRQN